MLPVILVAAAKIITHTSPHWIDTLISIGAVAAALGAIGAVGVFFWTKLRLYRVWKWLFKHIREDQKKARQEELLEAMSSADVMAIRASDLKGVLDAQVTPQFEQIKAAHQELKTGQSNLDRSLLEHIQDEGGILAEIREAQDKIHGRIDDHMLREERIDDHMLREEEAAAAMNDILGKNTEHVSQISTAVDRITAEQKKLADALALELERVARDRPVWLEDRRLLQEYMTKGSTYMETHEDGPSV